MSGESVATTSSGDESESGQNPRVLPSKTIAKEFIAAYRKQRFLWDPSHAHYNSKFRRSKAYDEMAPILRQCSPTANRELVRRQINVLRTNYRKIHRRYLRSKTVIDGEECYTFTPKNWKYYELNFLAEVFSNKEGTVDASDSDPDVRTAIQNSSCDTTGNNTAKRRKTMTKGIYDENVAFEIVHEASKEEFNSIARNVALKLKRMSTDQQYHAELLINKIVINALKGKLNDATDIVGLPPKVKKNDGDHEVTDFDAEIYEDD